MVELGQLERRFDDFIQRNVRVVVVSVEGVEEARKTQEDFPHLLVLADQGRGLSEAVDVIHTQSDPEGGDTSAPTTLLVDRRGIVRWLFRPSEVLARLSPEEVLQAIDQHLR